MKDHTTLDRDDLAGELEAIADTLLAVSCPLLEGDNRLSDTVLGNVLHATSYHLQRISDELSNYVPGEGAAE